MEGRPLISVVIPAYNVEKYIRRCIESILDQTEQRVEILVYDDGSLDNTLHEVENIKNERIKIFSGAKNRGVVFARNTLLKHANGSFVAFQDADDWSHPARLELQVNYLLSHPNVASCGTQFTKIVDNRAIFSSSFPCDSNSVTGAIPETFLFLPASIMVRKSVLDQVGWYSAFFGNDGNEDVYLASKIALTGGLDNVNRHLYYYNLNLTSLTKLGHLNKRKIYIHKINALLLKDLMQRGTNILEMADAEELACLDRQFSLAYENVREFDVFESVIGQLLFYRQYGLAFRETIRYGLQTKHILDAGRLLFYVARKSLLR